MFHSKLYHLHVCGPETPVKESAGSGTELLKRKAKNVPAFEYWFMLTFDRFRVLFIQGLTFRHLLRFIRHA